MAYRSNEPYNELPGLPPRLPIETTRVMRRCVTASRALAELKGAGNLLPNQSILINAIPLQEAKLSSEIENIVTTQIVWFVLWWKSPAAPIHRPEKCCAIARRYGMASTRCKAARLMSI